MAAALPEVPSYDDVMSASQGRSRTGQHDDQEVEDGMPLLFRDGTLEVEGGPAW